MTERLYPIGADGAHGGWLAVACSGEAPDAQGEIRRRTIDLCSTLDHLIALRDRDDVPAAVDMPTGLLDKKRQSNAFQPQSRPLLAAETQPEQRIA